MKRFFLVCAIASTSSVAWGAVMSQTDHGSATDLSDLTYPPSSTDLIQGELPSTISGIGGQFGFRTDPPATPAAEQDIAYTDGLGNIAGLTGLLADNDGPPISGRVIQTVEYALDDARVDEVRVYTGNTSGDARQFSTFVLSLSTDGGASFSPVGSSGYFQSDATNTAPVPGEISTLQRVYDPTGPLALGVDALKIDFYASGNNNPQRAVDPFDGVNPFTGVDDEQFTANQSPLVWEIDVIAIPEPSTIALLAVVAGGLASFHRRRM
jgi:hypothetical protein